MIVVQFSCNTPASVASFHVMMRSLFFISQVLEIANVIIYLIIFGTDFSLQLIRHVVYFSLSYPLLVSIICLFIPLLVGFSSLPFQI
jgi:hypothetical protein